MDEKTKETLDIVYHLTRHIIGAPIEPYDYKREMAALAHLQEMAEENELDKMLIADLTKDMNEYHDKAEKAEAELEELQDADNRVECWTCNQLKIPEDMNYQCLDCWGEKEVAKDAAVSKLKAELAATDAAWVIKQKQLEEARAELEKVKAEVEEKEKEQRRINSFMDEFMPLDEKNAAATWEKFIEKVRSAMAQNEKFRPLIEAARGVDKRVAWQELANSDIVHGLDGGLYDLLTAIPEDK